MDWVRNKESSRSAESWSFMDSDPLYHTSIGSYKITEIMSIARTYPNPDNPINERILPINERRSGRFWKGGRVRL